MVKIDIDGILRRGNKFLKMKLGLYVEEGGGYLELCP